MIAIIKYNAGNSRSVFNSLQRIGVKAVITDAPNTIRNADKVIFPGVGEAHSAMRYLKDNSLDDTIKSLTQPFLGICLGMQLMCKSSEEGKTEGLNIFDTEVKRFPEGDLVPHMGWNNCRKLKTPLFQLIDKEDFYFVHSYYADICAETSAICDYIVPFSAALQKDNFYGIQFHAEKSGQAGELILKEFLKL